jgi:hypothetical protein
MSQKRAIFGKLGEAWLGGPFRAYDTGTVQGLACVREGTADVLAIVAKTEGRGDGGRFLDALTRNYAQVRVWAITNPALQAMLFRRGFYESMERHLEGEELEWAMVWRKPTQETTR